jgi:hypothetical protein
MHDKHNVDVTTMFDFSVYYGNKNHTAGMTIQHVTRNKHYSNKKGVYPMSVVSGHLEIIFHDH